MVTCGLLSAWRRREPRYQYRIRNGMVQVESSTMFRLTPCQRLSTRVYTWHSVSLAIASSPVRDEVPRPRALTHGGATRARAYTANTTAVSSRYTTMNISCVCHRTSLAVKPNTTPESSWEQLTPLGSQGDASQRALSVPQRALSVTQRALSVTQRALSVTQRALSVTQRALSRHPASSQRHSASS
jgi:hypothetical protein